jgi:hypothetical protein
MPAQLLIRRSVVALALVIGTAWPPTGAKATTAIPSGQTGTVLPGVTVTAIVGDVDGDGIRELVRLTPRDGDVGHVAVEVVSIGSDGRPQLHGQALLERGAGVEEHLQPGPRPDEHNLLPARIDEPARLLAWHLSGVEQVLAVAIGTLVARPPCCLTIWRVGVSGGATVLSATGDADGGAEQIRAVDMDADGTDELVVVRAAEAISVLRWVDGEFLALDSSLTPPNLGPLLALGESDGRPGDEVGAIASSGTEAGSAILQRISLDEAGRLRTERADLPFDGGLVALPGPNGGRLVLASEFSGTSLLRWPAGAAVIEVEARSALRGFPLAALGAGEGARLLLFRGEVVTVLAPDLRPERVGVPRGEATAAFGLMRSLPYQGPLPGGLPGGEGAFLLRGRMLAVMRTPDPTGALQERLVAALPGIFPVGVVGPGGAWMALAEPTSLARPRGFDATREGGQLVEPAGPARDILTVVARTETVLSPESGGGALEVATDGAVEGVGRGSRRTLLARAPFTVRVAAPVESRVLVQAGAAITEALVDGSGAATMTVDGGRADGGETYLVSIVVVTPSGHGYAAHWAVRMLTKPPGVQASAPLAPFSFDVPLTGRTAPGVRIIVDGTEVAVGPDGSFALRVQVGPLPRDVRIEAIDAVGNRAVKTLGVVGFFDYRRLPWIPIVVVLTIVVAVLLYLRVPRPAPPTASRAGDDATFEEIE